MKDKTDFPEWRKHYLEFMYNPENVGNCSECPEKYRGIGLAGTEALWPAELLGILPLRGYVNCNPHTIVSNGRHSSILPLLLCFSFFSKMWHMGHVVNYMHIQENKKPV